jgi:DNA invertase Pin-like site-specific DNA recombinase
MTRDDIIRMADQAFDESSFTDSEVLRFAALVAAAERERAIEISKGMQEELQAKFEQTYMEGVIAGAAAEREAIAQMIEDAPPLVEFSQNDKGGCMVCGFTPKLASAAIRARSES